MEPLKIDSGTFTNSYEFSIISLVNNWDHYQLMLDSFKKKGFNEENSEFLYLDNLTSNNWDGFSGLNQALYFAKGKYIILSHQDIRLDFDDINDLRVLIKNLDKLDPSWAVLGNAGGSLDLNQKFIRITDPSGYNQSYGSLPAKVETLDENFILIKASSRVGFSNDLKGFHFYGFDLCQQARYRGYSCYAIPFHVKHLSSGVKDDNFYYSKKILINNHRIKCKTRFIRLTTTRICLSTNSIIAQLANQKFILFFLRKTKLYKLF